MYIADNVWSLWNTYQSVLLYSLCKEEFEDESKIDANHWFCLNDSMWSTIPAVQVGSYRMLKK